MNNNYVNDFNHTVKTYYKDISNTKPLTKEEEQLLMSKAKQNDINSRNKILTSNLKFVFSVAKKYKGKGVPMEDLISEGNMGLLYAYDKFKEEKNVKFFSYAVWWINFYIQDYIRKQQAISNREISEEEAFPTTNNEEDEMSLKEEIADNNLIEENEEIIYQKETIKKLLSKLTPRERLIIESYFGLKGNKPMNLKECSKLVGLSQERCRQLKSKSILKMRSELLLFA